MLILETSAINLDQRRTSGSAWVLIVSLFRFKIALVDIFLPSYSRWPMSFMKKILSGDKKYVSECFIVLLSWSTLFRYIRNKQVINFEIPKYPELATKNVWPLIKVNQDLVAFFPDLRDTQLPEKEFMYGIVSTVMP